MRAKRFIGALLISFAPAIASAYVFMADSGNGFYWKPGEIQIELMFGPSPQLQDGSSWNIAAQAALDEWNQQLTAVHLAAVSTDSTVGGLNNGANEAFFGSEVYGQSFGPNVGAITIVTSSGYPERNTEADVIFNAAFHWDSYRGPLQNSGDGPLDFRRIALHEFGHVIGLAHPDKDGSSDVPAIMNSATADLEHLTEDDIAGAQYLYGPGNPPAILAQPSLDAIPSLGSDLQITCTVLGTPPFAYEFYRDGQLVRTDYQFRGLPHDVAAFTVGFDQAADFGTYRFDIVNRVGRVSTRNFVLNAGTATAAPTIVESPRAFALSPGQSGVLVVDASGTPAPTFRWFKDGSEITGQKDAALVLHGNSTDAGTYTVWAENAAGAAKSEPVQVSLVAAGALGAGWELVSPAVVPAYPQALAFGNGMFVAVGYAGGVLTSPDGLVWTRRSIGTAVSLETIVFAAGQFVAAGDPDRLTGEPVLFVSFDGIGWSRAHAKLPLNAIIEGLAYGNGRFVAIDLYGHSLSSTDGMEWQPGSWSAPAGDYLDAIAFGSGKFVVSSRTDRIWTSTDGIQWTQGSSSVSGGMSSLAFGNGLFVGGGPLARNSPLDQAVVATSPDGVKWTSHALQSLRSGGPRLTFLNGTFHLSDGADHLVSTDGASWQQRNFDQRGAWILGYGGGRYVALGYLGVSFCSRDGLSWVRTGREASASLASVSFASDRFLVFDQAQYSTDGIAWMPMQLAHVDNRSATFGSDAWVAVGTGITRSTDGQNWTVVQNQSETDFASVTYGAGRFVAVGNRSWTTGAGIAYSTDGQTWTDLSQPAGQRLRGIAYGNFGFVAVGAGGTILQSPNGVVWQVRDAHTTKELLGVVWTGSSYVAVGGDGYGSITVRKPGTPIQSNVTVARSTDGVNWATTVLPDEDILCAVCAIDQLVVASGTNGTTLFSTDDGLSWLPGPRAPVDIWRLAAGHHEILATGDSYPATLLRISPAAFSAGPRLLSTPTVTQLGSDVVVSLEPALSAPASVTWYRGGAVVAQSSGTTWKTSSDALRPAVYFAEVDRAVSRLPLVLAPQTSDGASGVVTLVESDIHHPNGNIYDQYLLTGPSAQIHAMSGKVARISYRDLSEDIVQVEFSGHGALTIELENFSGPGKPPNYNQDVDYMKGHARIFVSDADETTNVSVFSVGRINAVKQELFKSEVTYDGVADIALLAIHSRNGRFGGVWMGNASIWDNGDITGLWAPETDFLGPIIVGNISGSDEASAGLFLRSAASVKITGGSLAQPNAKPIAVQGTPALQFTAGTTSQGAELPEQKNAARFVRDGGDVTSQMAPLN